MKPTLLSSTLAAFLLPWSHAQAGDVVINEIMYHAAPVVPENTAKEWIELHNKGTNPVTLTGWRLDRGVSFTFPACTLAPFGYLVVAADTNTFLAEHPDFDPGQLFGNWGGKLRNSGEEIELEDAQGQTVDSVSYANEGDWALRRVAEPYPGRPDWWRGWQWTTLADGGGNSLELRNPEMPNQYGQNWSASRGSGGTPGGPNSFHSDNIAPMIVENRHLPVIPKSGAPVTISARIMDEETNNLTVTLQYRVDGAGTFTAVTMFDDGQHGDGLAGDGVFGAILPAQADKTVVEYYIHARDIGGHSRTWPAPSDDYGAQGANALYQVDDSTYSGKQSIYRIVTTASEWSAWLNLMDNVSGGRYSDAAMNATIILADGRGTEVCYNADLRNRGAGTRSARPHNFNISFPADRPLHGLTRLDFNTRTVHSQVTGKAVITAAGLPNAYGAPVQVRVNGRNLANASPSGGTDTFQYGSYYCFEPNNSEWAGLHFPDDPGGNIYKGIWNFDNYGLNTPANLQYLGTNPASYKTSYTPTGPTSYTGAYSKQSNSAEDDWSDLITLTYMLNNMAGSNYLQNLNRVVNVDEWLKYCAVNTLLLNMETTLATGAGDDYSMYRGLLDPRFVVLCHDLDTCLGQGDATVNYSRSIFDAAFGGGNRPGIHAFDLMLRHPDIAPRYYAILKELTDTTFSAAQLNPLLDQVLGGWVPENVIQNMKDAARDRRTNVLWQIPLSLSVTSNLPLFNGYPYTTAPAVTLSGQANAINTRSVKVNGTPATWSAWDARWTGTSTLLPGINRVLVQAFDANGLELERTWVDLWYNNGLFSPVSSPISVDSIWPQSAGPYVVSNTINVTATLTIEPGTTIAFLPGAGLNISGAGRLLAEGTETRHIRFASLPGGDGWAGLVFLNASNESRVAFADIERCGGATVGNHQAKILANNSKVFLDHVTFANTPAVQFISFDNSSFIVQNCTFPTYPAAASAPEMVHGINGIPAGGYGIFRDNYFGHTWGYNDTIGFTGGKRPSPILQIIGNVFDGASDDHLGLDSTDAWIEGNTFMHAHRDPNSTASPLDTASAISGGVDFTNVYSEWTIINNLFYDVDHACLSKAGGRFIFVNNTLVHVARENGAGLPGDIAAFDFTDDNVLLPDPSVGAGAYVAGNIIWDCPRLVANYSSSNHTVIFENNLLPVAWDGPGSNNIVADPRLNLALITNALLADWKAVQAALHPWPGSPALGTGLGGFDKGGLNPKGLLVFGEPEGTTRSTTATLRVAPGGVWNCGSAVSPYFWGYTHYYWRLDNGPWNGELSVAASPTITLSNLSNGPHTVYVLGKNDAGYYQNDLFVYPPTAGVYAHSTCSRTWIVNTNASRLLLNEVLANNRSAVPHEGSYPDLIELYNDSNQPVNLSGIGLTDDPHEPFKFVFPAGTSLGAGEYLVVYADSHPSATGFHLGFALDQMGGGVWLYDPAAQLVDSVVYGPQVPDLSIGRQADGTWTLAYPTFGVPNEPHPLGNPMALTINEWLAAPGGMFPDDFVELYNADPAPVSLGGLFLTDLPQSAPNKHEIPPLSFIGGQSCLVFMADGRPEAGTNHLNFKLSPDWGEIGLFTHNLQRIDSVFYGPQTADVSQGRTPSGSSALTSFARPTPGAANPGSAGGSTVTSEAINLVSFTSNWRYNWAGFDLGTAWRGTNYDDSGAPWNSGAAMFYYDSSTPGAFSIPVNTWIPIPGLPLPNAIYFRTRFTVTNELTGFNLTTAHLVDDGAVYYLNGQELYRYNMPTGPIAYSTRSAGTVSGNASVQPADEYLPITNLVRGDNVLAVEVHQANSGSSDVAFALTLDLIRFVTNYTTTQVVLSEVMANNESITNADGAVTDWVELYNPSPNATDLSGMSLTDDPANPRRWVFPAGTMLPAGGYRVVYWDGNAPASTNSTATLNTGFGLKANGDKVYLFDNPSRGGAPLDSIIFGVQACDFSLGRAPETSGSWKLCLPTPGSRNIEASLGDLSLVKINEWLAEAGNDPDWFELDNPNNQPVDLSGCYLTDDLNNRTQYPPLPPYSYLGQGGKGFAVFYADKRPDLGADHLNFKLDKDGECIGLYSPAQGLIDAISFGAQKQNVSEGRLPDGSAKIVKFTSSVSPRAANYLPLTQVVINEALTYPVAPLPQAIELRNTSAESLDIGGWWLSNARDDLKRFHIPANTVIPAGGCVVFYDSQFNPPPGRLPSFALNSNRSDEIYLSQTDSAGQLTGFRNVVNFGAAELGMSFGRHETSVGADFVAMGQRTFGQDEPSTASGSHAGLPNAYPKVGPIVISEIHYHPPSLGTNDNMLDEYIELFNGSAEAVPLFHPESPAHTWHLRDGIEYDFPTNIILQPHAYLLVVSYDPQRQTNQLALFRTKYGLGPNVPIFGPYIGKLANDNDTIELRKPGLPDLTGDAPYILVERIKYSDDAPWPSAADGNTNNGTLGLSLQRRFVSGYGNEPTNWVASVPTPGAGNGSASSPAPEITAQPVSQDALPGANISFAVTATGALSLSYQWRVDGVALPEGTNSSLLLTNISPAQAGSYSVRVSNPYGSAWSGPARLEILMRPEITSLPQSRTVALNGSTTFSVTARGTAPIHYQWQKNGSPLLNATEAILVLTNVQFGDAGGFTVVLSNNFGAVTSQVALLEVNVPPLIEVQPQDQVVLAGGPVTFRVQATGSEPLRYQWRRNGINLPGQTNSTFELMDAQLASAGLYSVLINNNVAGVVTRNATLTVITPPTINVEATFPLIEEVDWYTGVFTLSRIGATNLPVTVNFTFSGTAINGTDYALISSPVTLPAGVSSVEVFVHPIDNSIPERSKTVLLTLSPGQGYVVGLSNMATITILDDENQWPFAILTSPTNNSFSPISPTNILLSAVAFDPDGELSRVDFLNNGTNLIGSVTAPPYELVWTNARAGTNLLTARAIDNLDAEGISSEVTIVVNYPPTVAIVSPTNQTRFAAPANIPIQIAAGDLDGTVTNVSVYAGGTLLGSSRTGGVFSLAWNNVPASTNLLWAVATDNWGLLSTSSVVRLYVGSVRTNFADSFADRGILNGSSHVLSANSANALSEPGEPAPFAGTGRRTVWITWVAPATGRCALETQGSAFDTVVSVYTNNPPSVESITNLVLVAGDDDGGVGSESRLVFLAVAGTAYHIRVAGFGAVEGGAFSFYLRLGGPNDLLPGPTGLEVCAVSGSQIAVGWNPSPVNVEGYQVERSLDGTNFLPVASISPSRTTYLDTRLTANTRYYYRVRAFDAYGPSLYTPIQSAWTSPAYDRFAVHINFAPESAPVPPGWEADDGMVFGNRGNGYSYGWDQDNGANARADGSPLSPYDSFQYMQGGGEDRVWELAVPVSGYYIVHTVAGSPSDYEGNYRVMVEGVLAIDGQPSMANPFLEASNIVLVTDGRLTVTCAPGAVDNRLAFVEITAAIPAWFVSQPASRTCARGSLTTFTGLAEGTPPLSYQWRKDGVDIPGATSALYALTNIQDAHAGLYAVVVTSPCGSITSAPAALTVIAVEPDLYDSFDPGIHSEQWSELSGAVAGPGSAGSTSGTNSLLFGGDTLRYAMTRPLNTTAGGLIDFQLRLSSAVVLPEEGVVLEFSTDLGNAWTTLRTYATSNYMSWNRIRESIPTAARTPATLFRWRQTPLSGNCCGQWALDDVCILVSTSTPPAIRWEPTDQIAPLKSFAAFKVAAVGALPLTYQWSCNGVALPGQTNDTLVLTNISYYSQGGYSVAANNAFGAATSRVARLAVDLGTTEVYIRIFDLTNAWRYNQAEDLTGTGWYTPNYDDSAWPSGPGFLGYESGSWLNDYILTTLADPRTAAPGLSAPRVYYFRTPFIWNNDVSISYLIGLTLVDDGAVIYFNGQPIEPTLRMASTHPGYYDRATSKPPSGDGDATPEYVYPPLGLLHPGTNFIAAEVHQESANSSDITWGMALYGVHLESNVFPVIITQPVSQTVSPGATVEVSVAATGYPAPVYQWRLNGNPVSGRTNSTLILSNVTLSSAGDYTVLVTNITGMATSRVATLAVRVPPSIYIQPPANLPVYAGTNVTLRAYASGASPLCYQWFWNGSILEGATSNALVLSNILSSMSGQYFLRVTNLFGAVTSTVATITVSNPAITSASMRYSNGVFSLPFRGCTLGSYTIECSSNLIQWTPLATTNRPTAPLIYMDRTATNTMRYYRLRWNP